MPNSKPSQRVFQFGTGRTDGNASMRDLLGGKGANLAEMSSLGLPVPPGFTITTDVCTAYYTDGGKLPDGLRQEAEAAPQALIGAGLSSGAGFSRPSSALVSRDVGSSSTTVRWLSVGSCGLVKAADAAMLPTLCAD